VNARRQLRALRLQDGLDRLLQRLLGKHKGIGGVAGL
jgi:hypothetical protein